MGYSIFRNKTQIYQLDIVFFMDQSLRYTWKKKEKKYSFLKLKVGSVIYSSIENSRITISKSYFLKNLVVEVLPYCYLNYENLNKYRNHHKKKNGDILSIQEKHNFFIISESIFAYNFADVSLNNLSKNIIINIR